MAGFVNDNSNKEILVADNVNFSGDATPTGKVTTNGQLLIGSTSTPNIQVGTITSPLGTVTIGYSSPNITLDVATGTGVVQTLTGNSGGAIAPVAGNINTVGTGSLTVAGAGNTLTAQLTGLTNHSVLVGAGTATVTKVGPTATAGQVLQSAGSSADPAFSTATYPLTTTINEILFSSAANTVTGLSTANDGVLVTSNTGVPSWLANSGTPGYILTANTGAPPSWQPTTSSQMAWVNNPGNITVSNNTGYTISTTTTLTLPASPSIGFSFSCADYGTGNITIQANTGQNINIGNNTSNVAGTASDNGAGSLTLVFNGGSRWIAISLVGTWNLN